MAGSLIKIDEQIVTSAVASVSLLGIDSTYDVYMMQFYNTVPDIDGIDLRMRVTESSTPNTTSNYDRASKLLRTSTTFANQSATNETSWDMGTNVGNQTGEAYNGTCYIFNANNSSEYTFFTKEIVEFNSTPELVGQQGGGVFTSSSSVNGVNLFFQSSNNIASGTFSLYSLKK
jgi:hypothetical protein